MNDKPPQDGTKKPFEAPRLIAIELAAEEVLANACKLDTGISAFDGQPCSITACSYRGS